MVDYYTLHWSDFVGQSSDVPACVYIFPLQTDRIDPKDFGIVFTTLVAILLGINLYYKSPPLI